MQVHKNNSETNDHIALSRQQKREDFLKRCGMAKTSLTPMQADASFRRYYRIEGAGRPLLMMEDPPDRPPVPPYVMVEPFMKIAAHLRAMGLRAPEIFYEDIPNGLLILEDFGEATYTRLFAQARAEWPLYELAVDALAHLHRHPKRNDLTLPAYDTKLLTDEAMLLIDWYYPALTGKTPSDDLKNSYADVWAALAQKIPADQKTLVLRDYHVDNLMLVEGAKGLSACGLLDFQDATIGHFSYDLMSLLEDARRDVPQALQKTIYDRYMTAMGDGFDRAAFDRAYRILAAQRHAKVLGIFVRLFKRDGKDRYLQFIPHVHRLFMRALSSPDLAPLQEWFQKNKVEIEHVLKLEK